MYLKPALGFLFAFIGLIALAFMGLEFMLGDLVVDNTTIALIGLATVALIGGGATVAVAETKKTA